MDESTPCLRCGERAMIGADYCRRCWRLNRNEDPARAAQRKKLANYIIFLLIKLTVLAGLGILYYFYH